MESQCALLIITKEYACLPKSIINQPLTSEVVEALTVVATAEARVIARLRCMSAPSRHLQPFADPTRRYNVGQVSLACHINTACLSEEHDSDLVDLCVPWEVRICCKIPGCSHRQQNRQPRLSLHKAASWLADPAAASSLSPSRLPPSLPAASDRPLLVWTCSGCGTKAVSQRFGGSLNRAVGYYTL